MSSNSESKPAARRAQRFLDCARKTEGIECILVIRSGMLGDTVFITPVLSRLHHTFPSAEIDVLVSENSAPLLKHLPSVHEVVSLKRSSSLLEETVLYAGLGSRRYDIVVVQETNSHYALMARLIRSRFLVGFENKLDLLLHHTAPWNPRIHFVDNQVATVRAWTTPPAADKTELFISNDETESVRTLLGAHGVGASEVVICIHPGTSHQNFVRYWIAERYAQLADELTVSRGCRIVFTGTRADIPEIERIRGMMKSSSMSLAGETGLREMMALMHHATLVIGPDTGVLHIANAVGTPVVMLMGFADAADTGPYDPGGLSRVVTASLPCSPCVERIPKPAQWEICKHANPVLCMERITTEMVMDAARQATNVQRR